MRDRLKSSYGKLRKLIKDPHKEAPLYKDEGYRFVLSNNSLEAVGKYHAEVAAGDVKPGKYLREIIAKRLNKPALTDTEIQAYVKDINAYDFLELIIKSKRVKAFAESGVLGDGSDWNKTELEILNSINTFIPVTIFDNAKWEVNRNNVHKKPFSGYLMLTNGIRLAKAKNAVSPDRDVVVKMSSDGKPYIDKFQYRKLMEERLVPLLLEANRVAHEKAKKAFITLPGIGCDSFAGEEFKNIIIPIFQTTLMQILADHQHELAHIQGVMFDSRNGDKSDLKVGHMDVLVRRSIDDPTVAMLNHPSSYGSKYKDCELFSFVAGDPNSDPGCDFIYGLTPDDKGKRWTNEGVVAASTDMMTKVTNIPGEYNAEQNRYDVAADPDKSWGKVIIENDIELSMDDARSYSVRPVLSFVQTADALQDLKVYLNNSINSKKRDKLAWARKSYVEETLTKIDQMLKSLTNYDDRVSYLNYEIESIRTNEKLAKHHHSIGGLINRLTNSDTTVSKLLIGYLINLRDAQRYTDLSKLDAHQQKSPSLTRRT